MSVTHHSKTESIPETPRWRSFRFAPPGSFSREVQAEARRYLDAEHDNRFADASIWITGLAILVAAVSLYALILSGRLGPLETLGASMLAATTLFMLMSSLGHDAVHGALSPRRWVNEAVVFLGFALLGADGRLWRARHLRIHHQFPNTAGSDIDAEGSDIIRLSPNRPHRFVHRLQPLYAGGVYALVLAHVTWVEDWMHLAVARTAWPREFAGRRPLALMLVGKALHAAVWLVIPWLVLQPSLPALLATYLAASATASLVFIGLNISSHHSEGVSFVQPDADGRLPHDWATHQLITSVDWEPESWTVGRLLGGTNTHVAHHLFPHFNHRHGPALTRLIAASAGRHRLPHRVVSFMGMLQGHIRHVGRMSVAEGPRERSLRNTTSVSITSHPGRSPAHT